MEPSRTNWLGFICDERRKRGVVWSGKKEKKRKRRRVGDMDGVWVKGMGNG